MNVNLEKLRTKQVFVKLRKGQILKMGKIQGTDRDNVITGPKELQLDGATVFQYLHKFDDENGIREQLGMPVVANRSETLKERMERVSTERTARQEANIRSVVREEFERLSSTKKEETFEKPKRRRGRPPKNKNLDAPAVDRSVGPALTE